MEVGTLKKFILIVISNVLTHNTIAVQLFISKLMTFLTSRIQPKAKFVADKEFLGQLDSSAQYVVEMKCQVKWKPLSSETRFTNENRNSKRHR